MRQSNIELIRIVAMLFIIAYHLLSFVVLPNYENDNAMLKSAELLFHTGVVLFVLISGYFSIKLSVKSVLKLIFPIFIYYVPAMIFYGDTGLGGVFLLSKSPYWFVKIYLFLLLLSPFVNRLWDRTSRKQHAYILCTLAFFSVYMGTIYGETSLVDGKNIVHFVLLYYIGKTICNYRQQIINVGTIRPLLIYVCIVFCIIMLYIIFSESLIGTVVWFMALRYNSPLLMLESILLFIALSNMIIKSKVINRLASAAFPVYIMHNQKIFLLWLAPAFFNYLNLSNNFYLMIAVVLIALFTYLAGFIIHQIMSPFIDRSISFLCYKLKKIDKFIEIEIIKI